MSGGYFRRNSAGIKRSSVGVEVPNNPKSNLMYYVACISCVLDLENEKNIERLRDFKKYYLLTEKEVNELLLLCYVLNPDYLMKKCIFQDRTLSGENQNEFYDLQAFQRRFPVAPVFIDGVPRQVLKIMTFKLDFLIDNYYEPMLFYKPKLVQLLNLQGRGDDFSLHAPKDVSRHATPRHDYPSQQSLLDNLMGKPEVKPRSVNSVKIIKETYPSPCCDCWTCTIL